MAHQIEALWCDAYGVFVRGWAHAYSDPVRRIAIRSGIERVETVDFLLRPDVLRHYPDHPSVINTGFALYLECAPFRPVFLVIETDAGVAHVDVGVPSHLRSAKMHAEQPNSDPEGVFVAAMNAIGGTVLEIGGRRVSAIPAGLPARLSAECIYLISDIHAAEGVNIVADAHFLSEEVPAASIDGVFSVAVLEHLAAPWLVAAEINRVLKPGGLTLHAVPQSSAMHERPNDFWRMSDEGLRVLFGPPLGFEVIETWMGAPTYMYPPPPLRSGPWCDIGLHPGYGTSVILSRKIGEVPAGAVAWPIARQALRAQSERYPVRAVQTRAIEP